MRAVIVPVGVTRETVEGVFKRIAPLDIVVAVTLPGYEEVKKPILEGLKGLAELIGAEYFVVIVEPGSVDGFVRIYDILREHKPNEVYLVGVTGSRYLLPPLLTVLLKYWRDTSVRLYLLHGVEGEEYSIELLPGFFATAMRLSEVQKQVLEIVYGGDKPISGKDLKEKYGFTHSVYAVLRDLERKGLLVVRRGRIERTFPGRLVYTLLKAGGEVNG